MRKNAWICCLNTLRRLIVTPRTWAVLIVSILFLENQFAPIRALLADEQLTMSWPGLLLYLFNDPTVTFFSGALFLMLIFDAPATDEMQRYIILRTGRGAWALGHIGFLLIVTALYLLAQALIVLALMLPWADFSGDWSGGLLAFVEDGAYEVYDSMLNYDLWLMRLYSPIGGALRVLSLHFLAYLFLALLLCAGNGASGARAGFLLSSAVLLLDLFADEYFPVFASYFSPVTLSRPSALDLMDQMGKPPLWYAYLSLAALCALMGLFLYRLLRRKEFKL